MTPNFPLVRLGAAGTANFGLLALAELIGIRALSSGGPHDEYF